MSHTKIERTTYMYDPLTIQGLEMNIPKEGEGNQSLINRSGLSTSTFKTNMNREHFERYIY
ncbi:MULTISPECIES: hypothetical protein [Priestia]|jgi:hypothetical protein|uniref:hypothetical protein n=1 Tax=Priestia TaxID=2800373 RepID=UPI00203C761E|nr:MULTISPECIES: hypothetical protein [Priestia]MCM3769030.1 hypothetical protein [Priestia aryabhattai]MDY0943262.1 hypothetical protein [Priestia megaterium]